MAAHESESTSRYSEPVGGELWTTCVVTLRRGYVSGAFVAVREGLEPEEIGRSPTFRLRKGSSLPAGAGEMTACFEALGAELESAGWERIGDDRGGQEQRFRRRVISVQRRISDYVPEADPDTFLWARLREAKPAGPPAEIPMAVPDPAVGFADPDADATPEAADPPDAVPAAGVQLAAPESKPPRASAKRLKAQRVEAERLQAERLEAERLDAERVEAERLEAERLEAGRLETERLETVRLETERLEAERLELERLAADRLEVERLEVERLEAKRLEAERLEAERLEAEHRAAIARAVEEAGLAHRIGSYSGNADPLYDIRALLVHPPKSHRRGRFTRKPR